jgi:hypothetical protein
MAGTRGGRHLQGQKQRSELEGVGVQVQQIVFRQDSRSGQLPFSKMTTGMNRAIRNAFYALNAAARIPGSVLLAALEGDRWLTQTLPSRLWSSKTS